MISQSSQTGLGTDPHFLPKAPVLWMTSGNPSLVVLGKVQTKHIFHDGDDGGDYSISLRLEKVVRDWYGYSGSLAELQHLLF